MFLALVALLVGTAHATTPVEELQGKRIASVGDAVTSTDAFDGETWFVFQVGGTSRTGYAFYGEDDYYNIPTGGTLAGIDAYGLAGILFKVIVNSGNTYSLMDGYGNYMAVSASTWDCYASTEGADYTTFTIAQIDASSDATQWYVQETSGSTILDTNSNFSTLVGWDTTVPTSTGSNNSHSFYPVTLEDYDGGVAIPDNREWTVADEAATELEEGTWYMINIGAQSSRAGWVYNAEMAPSSSSMYYNASSQPSTSLTSDQIAPYLFRIQTISEDDNTYAIINGEGTTLSLWSWTSVVAWPYSDVWEIENCDNDDYPGAFWAQEATYTYYLDNNGAGSTLGGWYASDKTYNGNGTLYFYEVTFSETEKEVEYIEDLASLGNSVTVIMQSERGVVASELGSTLLTSESSIDTSDETQKFVFYTTDDIDGYYLYSVNNAAFVTIYSDDDGSLSLDPTTFSILSSADNAGTDCEADTDTYPWIVKTTVGETAYLMNNNNAGDVVVDDWDEVDEGNAHRFVIVDEETDYAGEIAALLTETKEGAQVRVEDFLSNSMVIKMRADRGYGGYPTYDSSSTYGLTAVEDEADDESQSFVLYTTDDINGYYLYSVGAEQFVVANSSYYAELSDTPEIWTLSQDGYSEPTQSWRLYNSSSCYITAQNWTGYSLQATWWYADEGNSFRFIIEDAADEDVEDEIEALLASTDEWLQAHPAILTLDELDDSIAEGYTFYIKGALPGFVYAGESGLNASLSTASPSEEFDTSYEFGLIKHDDGEYFIYSVGQEAMLESDLVPNNRCVGLFTIGSPSSFTSLYWGDDGADTGSYPFWICDSVGENNINYNSSQGVVMTWWGYSDTGNCYVFHVGNATEELPEVYDVEISTLGWRTLALPKAVVAQSAVNVWSGDASQSTNSDGNTEFAFEIVSEPVIGAGVGVVLQAVEVASDDTDDTDDSSTSYSGNTYYYPYIPSAEVTIESNGMTGTSEGSVTFETASEAYVLREASTDDIEKGYDLGLGVVFSPIKAGETVGQYKAYVKAPADGSSISFSFGSTLVEGIGSVETAVEATGIYYDLQGRVVKNPAKGGIYIVDGQKIIK